jgi:hypothetical protein
MPSVSKRRSHSKRLSSRRWKEDAFGNEDYEFDMKMSIGLMNLEKEEEGTELKDKIDLQDIGDLYEMNKQEPSHRSLSVLLYLTLTHFGVSWRKTEEFMQQIGGMSPRTCHKWAETFIDEDYDDFVQDHRGGKREDSFFDTFPELETKMKLYAIEGATRKNASFSSLELARYLDDQYYALTGEVRPFSSQLSIDCSCFLCSSLFPRSKQQMN